VVIAISYWFWVIYIKKGSIKLQVVDVVRSMLV